MSEHPVESHLSPFVECGRATSSIGYRDASTGQVVASVEIPSETIERAVLANISAEIALSGAGEIASAGPAVTRRIPGHLGRRQCPRHAAPEHLQKKIEGSRLDRRQESRDRVSLRRKQR